jgi:hypothetical protein
MKTLRWGMGVIGILVVVGCEVSLSEALTCVRPSAAFAWCDDGTWVTDYSSRMREVTGPGAETGLQGYPIPFGGRADGIESPGLTAPAPAWGPSPAPVSAPPVWWQPTPGLTRGGGCAQWQGRTVCW